MNQANPHGRQVDTALHEALAPRPTRDLLPNPTDFEIEGPFVRRIGVATVAIAVVLMALACGGAGALLGYVGKVLRWV